MGFRPRDKVPGLLCHADARAGFKVSRPRGGVNNKMPRSGSILVGPCRAMRKGWSSMWGGAAQSFLFRDSCLVVPCFQNGNLFGNTPD